MKLNEFLGTEFPVIQGGMANIATGAFAAAVSNAGALGVIGSGGWDAGRLKEEIEICRGLTDKPFGVNVMLMNPDVENIAALLAREQIAVITTGAGNPGQYIPAWKEAGSKVIPVVAGTALARRAERAGADAVIAEGTESGGHVGEATTMALVPQVVDSVSIPVIAAGGIADSRQLVAALALGAIGVQVGTCLLVSRECPIHDNYKQALLKATDNGTIVTGRSIGAPVRILKNKLGREYVKLERQGVDKMELEKFTLGGLRRAVLDGDMQMGSAMTGQVCGMLKEIRPLRDILEQLCGGCGQVLETVKEKLP